MIKLSKRLQAIADYLELKDKVIDIGCDHGYLDIYLKKIKNLDNILAIDNKKMALEQAINNFKVYEVNINYKLSDGLKNVEVYDYDTLVIAGMGSFTIMNILKDIEKYSNIKKIIIQSNNDLEGIRRFLNNNKYYLEDETVVFEYKYYVIMKFIRSDKRVNSNILKYGIIKNEYRDYYKYILNKNLKLLNIVKSDKDKYKYLDNLIKDYQNIIERIEE